MQWQILRARWRGHQGVEQTAGCSVAKLTTPFHKVRIDAALFKKRTAPTETKTCAWPRGSGHVTRPKTTNWCFYISVHVRVTKNKIHPVKKTSLKFLVDILFPVYTIYCYTIITHDINLSEKKQIRVFPKSLNYSFKTEIFMVLKNHVLSNYLRILLPLS